MSTSERPLASSPSRMVPLTCAVNAGGAPALLPAARVVLAPSRAAPEAAAAVDASNALGVPARAAQPAASGPPGSHTSSPSGTTAEAIRAVTRAPALAGQPAVARATTATIMTITQPPVTASIQAILVSLPVPRPCSTATGQQAYAAQCVARHAR